MKVSEVDGYRAPQAFLCCMPSLRGTNAFWFLKPLIMLSPSLQRWVMLVS